MSTNWRLSVLQWKTLKMNLFYCSLNILISAITWDIEEQIKDIQILFTIILKLKNLQISKIIKKNISIIKPFFLNTVFSFFVIFLFGWSRGPIIKNNVKERAQIIISDIQSIVRKYFIDIGTRIISSKEKKLQQKLLLKWKPPRYLLNQTKEKKKNSVSIKVWNIKEKNIEMINIIK